MMISYERPTDPHLIVDCANTQEDSRWIKLWNFGEVVLKNRQRSPKAKKLKVTQNVKSLKSLNSVKEARA